MSAAPPVREFTTCFNPSSAPRTRNDRGPGKIDRAGLEKLAPARPLPEREEANRKLLERSARGKAAFAKRKAGTAIRARKAS